MATAPGPSLPRDPDEALRFGLRTIESAYEEKTRHLDHELQQLRAYSKQQQSQISALERRVSEMEMQAREGDERARVLSDEKVQLQQELKATQRDLSKLDSFKRSILQSIQDEDVPGGGAGIGALAGLGGYGGGSDFTPAVSGASATTPFGPGSPAPATGNPLGGMSGFGSSAGRASFLGASPAVPTGGSSPGGEQNAAAVMDGKDFFRQARLRLSYEQFNQFLSNIKRLNDHAQTRDETLARAQEIFGAENGDLFVSFKALLSKHGLT